MQANFGNAPIALRSHDGRLWLAMRTALVIVDPANLHENSQPPPVLLTRVSVSDRTVAAYSGVSVPKENGREIPELATTDAADCACRRIIGEWISNSRR